MTKKIANLIIATLISVSSLALSPGFSDFVLCLGEDGHLEFEYSVDGRCGSSGHAADEAVIVVADQPGHCGPCTDLRLAGDQGISRKDFKGLSISGSPATAQASLVPANHDAMATNGLLPLPPPEDSPHLVRLRTIRLLV